VAEKTSAEKQDGSNAFEPGARSRELSTNQAQERPAPSRAAPAPAAAPAPEAAAEPAATPPARAESALRREQSVDIEELIARVAARTGKEFLVDPRVRARVFAVPPIETPTYAELLSILRMHG